MISDKMRVEVEDLCARARAQGWELSSQSTWLFDQKKKLVEYAMVFVKHVNGKKETLRKKLSWGSFDENNPT